MSSSCLSRDSGLARYCGKMREALQFFNRARCDEEWNEKAMENMGNR